MFPYPDLSKVLISHFFFGTLSLFDFIELLRFLFRETCYVADKEIGELKCVLLENS